MDISKNNFDNLIKYLGRTLPSYNNFQYNDFYDRAAVERFCNECPPFSELLHLIEEYPEWENLDKENEFYEGGELCWYCGKRKGEKQHTGNREKMILTLYNILTKTKICTTPKDVFFALFFNTCPLLRSLSCF